MIHKYRIRSIFLKTSQYQKRDYWVSYILRDQDYLLPAR